jgi:tRNA G18 (ribose-2'-O)-methylase SpoU
LAVSVTPIDDAGDLRLADYRNIPDPDLARARGLFIAEGRLVVGRLLRSRFVTRSVMVTPAALDAVMPLLASHPCLSVYVVPQAVMNGVAGFNIHRGCLAVGERRDPDSWQTLADGATCLVALERVGNADNVGATFRAAAAFAVDGVLLEASCADPLYRKAIRTSMGASLQIGFAPDVPWPGTLRGLRDDGWLVVGLTPSDDAEPLERALDAPPGTRVAFVLGHEGDGLTPAAMAACTRLARIPMAAGVDSLNVSMAAGIALYERTRAAGASR